MKHLSEEQLQMLADKELDPVALAEAAAHVDGCESCRERYEQIASVVAFLEQRPDFALSPGFAETVAAGAVKPRRPAPVWRRVPVVAALIGLLAVLAWLANNSLGTVMDLAAYDLYTADVPAAYAIGLVVAILVVFAMDVLLARFGRVMSHRSVRHS